MAGHDWEPPDHIDLERISEVERDLGFHANEVRKVATDFVKGNYYALTDRQRKNLETSLGDESDELEYVQRLVRKCKDPSEYHKDETREYEKVTKETLEIPIEVRHGEDGLEDPTESQVNVFTKLYRATQCFVHVNVVDPRTKDLRVYRGIRGTSIAKIVAQALDKPDSDRYYFNTSVTSNHTGTEEIAFYHSTGIVIKWDAEPELIATAVDHLLDTPVREDEYHLVGGTIFVDSDGVIHEGAYTNDRRRLRTTLDRLESPEDMTAGEHRDVAQLIETMYENETGVTTDEGATYLENWFDEIRSGGPFSSAKLQFLNAAVQYITEVDQGKTWRGFP